MTTESKRKFTSMAVERHDKGTIILPDALSLKDGAKWLMSIDEEQQEPFTIYERTSAHPLDGAFALATALSRRYGNSRSIVTKIETMFGVHKSPPVMIDLPIDAKGTSVKVPWGRLAIPGVNPEDGWLETGVDFEAGRPTFSLRGEMRKKHQAEVAAIAADMREIIATESIYRGKAIRVATLEVDQREWTGNPSQALPQFIDVEGITMDSVILNRSVEEQINDYVLAPIRYPEGLKALGMRQKRGVLLTGTYGVGKSLTSRVIANEATQKGMTFIYLEDASLLADAYRMAMDYAPAVLFVEDVDKVTSGARDDDMNRVLNILDGIESKTSEVTTVFTTNELASIHKAFERPGRIDVIIEVTPPDADTAARLVRLYAGEALDPTADMAAIGESLKGSIPALIAETVQRSKMSSLSRAGGDPGQVVVTASDILLASESLSTTRRLLEVEDQPTPLVLEHVGRAALRAVSEQAETAR